MKICLFGHFGTFNLGNEATLQAMLYHLRRLLPKTEIACICTGPEAVAATHNIQSLPISRIIVKVRTFSNPLAKFMRRVLIGIPSECYRWVDCFKTLRGTHMLIIPGTGLLTDAYGLLGWGPYNLFKWVLVAKLRRCRVLFVSVGAGPIHGMLGRYFVKSALSLADFRSYRDNASMAYLRGIGLATNGDRVYPDLVFSLPKPMIPDQGGKQGKRPVVGLGLMEYAGRYSIENPSQAVYSGYLEKLVSFGAWLLSQEYDIRLLIGDSGDRSATEVLKAQLKARLGASAEARVIDHPMGSVDQLLGQLAATDIVVATRFHNVLFALLLEKPVISISFHEKCSSLMRQMRLSEFCLNMGEFSAGCLIEKFSDLEKNADRLRLLIKQRTVEFRAALDEQYNIIFRDM
jgi:polysaccharide pyruvyl transferase WcaK-like protein